MIVVAALVGAGVTEGIRFVRARRLQPELALIHPSTAMSNVRQERHEAHLMLSIENTGKATAHDWRVTLASPRNHNTVKLPMGHHNSPVASQRPEGDRWVAYLSSGEGEVIQPSASHPLPNLIAEVPGEGDTVAEYTLQSGPHSWRGSITLENLNPKECSVTINVNEGGNLCEGALPPGPGYSDHRL
jgi:hypothetical protein